MGHQLWTSPITGYRRKGTRLAELRDLLDRGITAHAILEPLQSCPADASAVEIAAVLSARDFDVAGVKLQAEDPVSGFVLRSELKAGSVGDYLEPFTERHLIADSTPLASMFSVLKDENFIFVLIGPDVKGIVTRADLNKPSIRIYLFGLISLLEMHLTFWVRSSYPDDTWKERLTQARLNKAESLQNIRRDRNQEISLVDCLQMCDKRDLVIVCHDHCRMLEVDNCDEYELRLKQSEDLRNLLAHSQQDIIEGSSWEELFQLVKWIESFLHKSDNIIEKNAQKFANRYNDGLWGSA